MRRVLLVSYYFPPVAGSGVFRPLRLARYLPDAGWEVTVLGVGSKARLLRDEALLREVPARTRVERTASLEPRTLLLALNRVGLRSLSRRVEPWFRIPDDQRGWVPFAVRRAMRALRERPHDAILTTSGPTSAHLVGLALERRLQVPWVADFRDEWTTNPYVRYPTAWHRRLNERMERAVLSESDRVVCVSAPWLDNLRSRTPGAPPEKFRVLPNGYDAAHFDGFPGERPDCFRVVYTGTFYGHRSPRVFLEAVARVVAENRIPARDLDVVLVGHTAGAAGLGAPAAKGIRVLEQRPFHETLDHLRSAAVLLVVIPAEGGAGNHTGKLFNYLAAGRPILALAPVPNVAVDLILESRSGVVAPPDDPAAVAEALVELYRRFKARVPFDQDRAVVERYEARPQAAAYARLLEEVV